MAIINTFGHNYSTWCKYLKDNVMKQTVYWIHKLPSKFDDLRADAINLGEVIKYHKRSKMKDNPLDP